MSDPQYNHLEYPNIQNPLEVPEKDPRYCTNHPEMEAVEFCQQCRAPLCNTCDFQFPGNLHLCPTCATTTSRPMSTTRKQLLTFSFVAAIFTTMIIGMMFAGVFAQAAEDEIVATVLGTVIMISSLVGVALSFSSLDNKAGNTPLCWVAVIWNLLLMGVWILLCIIGLAMG